MERIYFSKTWRILIAVTLLVLPVLAACAGGAQPEATGPIVLGAPLATGFVYGWDAERALTLAVDEINTEGGVDVGGTMRPFQLEVIDTRDLEAGVPTSDALLAVEKLILEKNADFIVGGPVRSEAALAAMDLMNKYKKVQILSTGALTPAINDKIVEEHDKYKYTFRISGEAKSIVGDIIAVLEDIRAKHGLDQGYIIIQDVAHARSGGDILNQLLTDKGWTIHGLDVYPTGTTDFSTSLLKAKDAGAQVLILWMDMPESSILLKQWHDLQVPALPFGSILAAAEQPGFWDATEGKGEYAIANLVNAGNAWTTMNDWVQKFYKAYEERWDVPPEAYGTSSSYMTAYVLKDAIERAGSLDPDAVIKALEETDLMGVYGRIKFDPETHQVVHSMDPNEGAVGTMVQWQGEDRVTIFPPAAAVGELQLPPWMSGQ
jgi:branched-chain amino acid transport system substrate-binding protein